MQVQELQKAQSQDSVKPIDQDSVKPIDHGEAHDGVEWPWNTKTNQGNLNQNGHGPISEVSGSKV